MKENYSQKCSQSKCSQLKRIVFPKEHLKLSEECSEPIKERPVDGGVARVFCEFSETYDNQTLALKVLFLLRTYNGFIYLTSSCSIYASNVSLGSISLFEPNVIVVHVFLLFCKLNINIKRFYC